MRSLRSISTTRDSSIRPNLRNSTAGAIAPRWHADVSCRAARGQVRQDEPEHAGVNRAAGNRRGTRAAQRPSRGCPSQGPFALVPHLSELDRLPLARAPADPAVGGRWLCPGSRPKFLRSHDDVEDERGRLLASLAGRQPDAAWLLAPEGERIMDERVTPGRERVERVLARFLLGDHLTGRDRVVEAR
jgi:hypothetical protein